MPRRHFLANRADDMEILRKGVASDADALFIDLEDGVAPAQKEQARANVADAFSEFDYSDKFRVVRLNDLDTDVGRRDLDLVQHRPEAVMLPKIESVDEVLEADDRIAEIEREHGIEVGTTKLFVMLETAWAVLKAEEILSATPRLTGFFFGPADLSVDLGTEGLSEDRFVYTETVEWARHRVLTAAAAADVEDAVGGVLTSRFDDYDEVREEAGTQFRYGHTGVLIITPRHVEPVNEAYRPSDEQQEYVRKVIDRFEELDDEGLGVAALNDQLLESPMYKIAKRIDERTRVDE